MWSCCVAASTSTRLLRAGACLLTALASAVATPHAAADPNALWDIVNGQCVPDQRMHNDPAPCASIDLSGGYAVLKDLVGATQFLLIPTEQIAGIESQEIAAADAPNYFADAWLARSYVEQRAGRPIPRDWLSLAINSSAARSQNQMHIHVDCVRADVRQSLAAHAADIGATWTPFPVPLAGQRYRAMAVAGEDLTANPFRLLADDVGEESMGAQTLVAVGTTAGFILLAGSSEDTVPGSGHGEDLQDHDVCPPPAELVGK